MRKKYKFGQLMSNRIRKDTSEKYDLQVQGRI